MSSKNICIPKHILAKKLAGEEWVLLNLQSGVYYGLNETGSLIWDGLCAGEDPEAILERLEETFQMKPSTLENDLRRLLKDLQKEELVRIESPP